MAISFSQKRKKQKLLIIVLICILVAIGIVVSLSFSGNPSVPPVQSSASELSATKVSIDFSILESSILRKLEPFNPIALPAAGGEGTGVDPGEVHRDNPFIPY